METESVAIRRQLGPADVDAIVALHDRVYRSEYEAGQDWVEMVVRLPIERAVARGWPQERALGSVWLADHEGTLSGSLALVLQCPRIGNLDWFLLAPHLRGRGLGKRLVAEAVAEARARGVHKLKIQTFSALAAAAHIYRDAGFQVVWEREADWYGSRVAHQVYELVLRPPASSGS